MSTQKPEDMDEAMREVAEAVRKETNNDLFGQFAPSAYFHWSDADTIDAAIAELAALRARVSELEGALYQAHVDLGASGGVAETDCACVFCTAYRAAQPSEYECPTCGYTAEDCRVHGDHHLCDTPWPAHSAKPGEADDA